MADIVAVIRRVIDPDAEYDVPSLADVRVLRDHADILEKIHVAYGIPDAAKSFHALLRDPRRLLAGIDPAPIGPTIRTIDGRYI